MDATFGGRFGKDWIGYEEEVVGLQLVKRPKRKREEYKKNKEGGDSKREKERDTDIDEVQSIKKNK